jgi:nitrite reductase/ring-hydroxylating ferredoxin subunit
LSEVRVPRSKASVSFSKSELPQGGRKALVIGRREIAVFNVNGRLFALFNRCPHQQAELLGGLISGTTLPTDTVPGFEYGLEGRVLRCPWHHYEFDLETGRCLADPDRLRVATYDVREEGEEIRVYA